PSTPAANAPAPAPAPQTMNPTAANPLAPKTVAAPPPVTPVRATSAEVITPSSNPGATTPVLDGRQFWKDSADVTPDQLIALYKHAPIDPRLRTGQKNDPRRFDSP